MHLSIYPLRGGDGVSVPRRVLVLVTDPQGRTWRAVVDEAASVDGVPMVGPVAPTPAGPIPRLQDVPRGPSLAHPVEVRGPVVVGKPYPGLRDDPYGVPTGVVPRGPSTTRDPDGPLPCGNLS